MSGDETNVTIKLSDLDELTASKRMTCTVKLALEQSNYLKGFVTN